mgnify:CR=1 FL=1|jgi:hypothetical protein
MTINARHCYTELAEAIEQACRERHYYIVTERAEALGLPGGGEGSGFSEKHAYSATDENGLMVDLAARWYDQSKAFSIRPDRHVFTLTLRSGDTVLSSLSREFEG